MVAAIASVIAAIAATVGVAFAISHYQARKRSELPTIKLEQVLHSPGYDSMFLASLKPNVHSFGWEIIQIDVAYSDVGPKCLSQFVTEAVECGVRGSQSDWKQTCFYPRADTFVFFDIHPNCFKADLVFTCVTLGPDWRTLGLRKRQRTVPYSYRRDVIEVLRQP